MLNLTQHRDEPNVWDNISQRCERDTERWLAAATAGVCLVYGLRQRSVSGLLLVVGSAFLGWWAAGGSDERNLWRGRLRAALPVRSSSTDPVAEASKQSFPASDAPAWTG